MGEIVASMELENTVDRDNASEGLRDESTERYPDCCINRNIRYCPDQAGSRLRENPSFLRKRESRDFRG